MNPNFECIGKQFIGAYYQIYDAPGRKPELVNFYQADSLLTFEGDQKQGKEEIVQRHMAISAETTHAITALDCQPTADGGVLIAVFGQIKTAGEDKPLGFNHTFVLRPTGDSFYISNEIFRLAVHNF